MAHSVKIEAINFEICDYSQAMQKPNIKRGDKNLSILSSRVEKGRLYTTVRYKLKDFQQMRLTSWQSNTLPTATGTGQSDLFQGPQNRRYAPSNP